MKKIKLTRGKFALVDDEDFKTLNKVKWYASPNYNTFYAARSEGAKKLFIHREVMNTPKGMMTDHIDGNGLNNQKSNLRICTSSQNQMNSTRRKKSKTGFRGVNYSKRDKVFRALIILNGKFKHLGSFSTPKEAHKAYCESVIKYHGEFLKSGQKEGWLKEGRIDYKNYDLSNLEQTSCPDGKPCCLVMHYKPKNK